MGISLNGTLMTLSTSITLQRGASPMEYHLARIIRRNIESPDQRFRLADLRGTISLRDSASLRDLCITIDDSTSIYIAETRITSVPDVIGNFDPFRGAPPQFQILDRWRRPFFAKKLNKLLRPQLAPWKTAAEQFLTEAEQIDPRDMTIESYCTDDGDVHAFGEGPQRMQIRGRHRTLAHLFNGYALLIDEILKGRIECLATMRNIALITDACTDQWLEAL